MAARCSGAIVLGVPPIEPGTGPPGTTGGRARWKSRSIGVPSAASRTLPGFTSMWTSPRPWAAWRASARQVATQATASG